MSTYFIYSYVVLWILVLSLTIVVTRLTRTGNNKALKQDQLPLNGQDKGIEIGTKFPKLELPLLDGGIYSINKSAPNGMVVAFVAANCSACKELLPHLSPFQLKNPRIPLLCIMMGEENEIIEIKTKYEIEVPISPLSFAQMDELGTKIFPFAYYLSNHGMVMAKGIVTNEEKLNRLVQSATNSKGIPSASIRLAK